MNLKLEENIIIKILAREDDRGAKQRCIFCVNSVYHRNSFCLANKVIIREIWGKGC